MIVNHHNIERFGIDLGTGKYHEEIIYTLALIYNKVHHNISNHLRQFNLSLGKWNILIVIKHQGREEGISQVDISKHLIVTPSNMTKMLDKLEDSGLVRRHAMEGDRRVKRIQITSRGSKLLDEVWEGYNSVLKEHVSGLKTEDQKQLAGLLVDWFHQLESHSEDNSG